MSKECLYCGRNLDGLTNWRQRKYCSTSCGNKFKLRIKKPGCQSKLWQHEPEVFERAMEMYWNGLSGVQIARRTGIPVGTIYCWIRYFGAQRERRMLAILPKPIKKQSARERFKAAKSAEEWSLALRENTPPDSGAPEDSAIYLVCGTFHGQSVNKYASVITERLKDNPLSGNVYAFCNKGQNTITTFAWKTPVFHIAKHIKLHGTFIWPGENLGRTIEVTSPEFDRLLFLNKQEILAERTAKSLAIMRISCYN